MRGFLSAVFLLAQSLAAAVALPAINFNQGQDIDDESFVSGPPRSIVGFQGKRDSTSPDGRVTFQLEVLRSEAACGFGNITFDGQVLPQTPYGDSTAGKGRLNTISPILGSILASWEFQCIRADGQPDSQLLKFVVHPLHGDAAEGRGFSVWFTQAGNPKILNIVYDLSTPDLVETQYSNTIHASDEASSVAQSYLGDDLADLEYLRAQLRELQALIVDKKLAIAAHHGQSDIMDCDSLTCVARTVGGHARKLVGMIYGGEENHAIPHFPKTHFPKPHWPKNPFHHGKPGNHTCGPPKHEKGNYTEPPPPKHGKGNHTHPHPPHHKRPHLPLPICRYPPPPPPPNGPPDGPSPHEPSLEHGHEQGRILLSAAEERSSHPSIHSSTPVQHDHRPYQIHRRHHGPNQAFHIIGIGLIGFLAALLITALHRRFFTPVTLAQREERRSRRVEHHTRRAMRRAAHKQAINNFLTRLGCQRSAEDEEKRATQLEDSDDAISTTMTDDITEFRNAADIVTDIIAAEEGRSRTRLVPVSRSDGSTYELNGQVEDEYLPAYEDHDGSEMSSVVVDGFRYSPGSTDYTPSSSGSASDILGPATKQ